MGVGGMDIEFGRKSGQVYMKDLYHSIIEGHLFTYVYCFIPILATSYSVILFFVLGVGPELPNLHFSKCINYCLNFDMFQYPLRQLLMSAVLGEVSG